MNENIFKDDYYENKGLSTGYNYNTSYIGQEIKDNSSKPSAPQFTISKAPRDNISK